MTSRVLVVVLVLVCAACGGPDDTTATAITTSTTAETGNEQDGDANDDSATPGTVSTVVAAPTTTPVAVEDARAVYDTLIAAGLPCGDYTAEPITPDTFGLPEQISYGTCPTGDLSINMNVYASITDVSRLAAALPALLGAVGVTEPLEFVVAGNVTVGFGDLAPTTPDTTAWLSAAADALGGDVQTLTPILADNASFTDANPSCDDAYGVGVIADETTGTLACVDANGTIVIAGTASTTCPDGTELYWNDYATWKTGKPITAPFPAGFTSDEVDTACTQL
jgi:hypothetical protein